MILVSNYEPTTLIAPDGGIHIRVGDIQPTQIFISERMEVYTMCVAVE